MELLLIEKRKIKKELLSVAAELQHHPAAWQPKVDLLLPHQEMW